jgi:hypothetical protein
MGWFVNDETHSDLSFNWTTPADHLSVTNIKWLTPNEHQQTQALNWLAVAADGLNTSVNWWNGYQHQTDVALQYHGDMRDNQCAVNGRTCCKMDLFKQLSTTKITGENSF